MGDGVRVAVGVAVGTSGAVKVGSGVLVGISVVVVVGGRGVSIGAGEEGKLQAVNPSMKIRIIIFFVFIERYYTV